MGRNFGLANVDKRGDDFYSSLIRTSFDHTIERFVISRTAVGIAGTVLFDSANEDLLSSQHFGPAYGDGQEVRVAKGHIGDGDVVARGVTGGAGCGHGDVFVSERGTTDGVQSLIADDEFVGNVEALANREERLETPGLGAFSVADGQGGGAVGANRQDCANAGIHSSAEQDHCAPFLFAKRQSSTTHRSAFTARILVRSYGVAAVTGQT